MVTPSLDATTIAYFAGLFDGEGWIHPYVQNGNGQYATAHRKRGTAFVLNVGLGSTDLSIPPEMLRLFGGHLSKVRIPGKNSRRPMQQWGCTNETAAQFLKVVYPFLRIKKRQAALAFKFREIQSQGRWSNVSYRHGLLRNLVEEVQALNKGIAPGVQTVKEAPRSTEMIQSEVSHVS